MFQVVQILYIKGLSLVPPKDYFIIFKLKKTIRQDIKNVRSLSIIFYRNKMRGYFGFGAEGISKPMNMGNLVRSAHAFGAQFVFTVSAHYSVREGKSDTSKAPNHLPWYDWDSCEEMVLPNKCKLVGVELIDDAIELPSFHHPKQAAYVLGPEMGSLSKEMIKKCDYTIKIPTKFCINVQIAGSIVMYDRIRSLGKFAQRPQTEVEQKND